MGGLPDLIFVLDTVKEQIAIQEATKLNIPIAAIIDSNSNPDGVTYPIPGNDDSTKSISLFCGLISKAALDGIAQSQNETSADTKTAPKVTKNKNVKTKDVKSDDDTFIASAASGAVSDDLQIIDAQASGDATE